MIAFAIFVALEALMYISIDVVMLTPSDKKLVRIFENTGFKPEIKRYKVGDHTIRYLDVGEKENPLIIFVHGAPGSLLDYSNLLKDSSLLANYRMISPDRSGYGSSEYGKSLVSLAEQARLLSPLLNLNQHVSKPILLGHSYGAPIAARMVMNYQHQIGKMYMTSGAVDPNNETIFWVSYPLDYKPISYLVPVGIRTANDEKLSHVAELKKMLPLWDKIEIPVTIMHGREDRLVPIENAHFADSLITNSVDKKLLIYDKTNHLIPFTNPQLIIDELLKEEVIAQVSNPN